MAEIDRYAEKSAAFLSMPPVRVLNMFVEYANIVGANGEIREISTELVLLSLSKRVELRYYFSIVYFEHIENLIRYAHYQLLQNNFATLKEN